MTKCTVEEAAALARKHVRIPAWDCAYQNSKLVAWISTRGAREQRKVERRWAPPSPCLHFEWSDGSQETIFQPAMGWLHLKLCYCLHSQASQHSCHRCPSQPAAGGGGEVKRLEGKRNGLTCDGIALMMPASQPRWRGRPLTASSCPTHGYGSN
jgi:hypothetical protein